MCTGGNIADRIKIATDLVTAAQENFNEARENYQRFADLHLTEGEAYEYFEEIFPGLKNRYPFKLKTNVWNRLFDTIRGLYFNGTGNRGESLWDAFNAVTEYTDFVRKMDDSKRLTYNSEGVGYQLKSRAYEVAVDLLPEIPIAGGFNMN